MYLFIYYELIDIIFHACNLKILYNLFLKINLCSNRTTFFYITENVNWNVQKNCPNGVNKKQLKNKNKRLFTKLNEG